VPLTRERIEESPDLAAHRAGALGDLDELGASLALPILFRGSLTGIFALGDKLSGAAYSTFDLRVLRLVANQSAVAIENARAYTALQQANTELRQALRRVEILESIRANLSKFVPATVQRLIEEAPESPELDKREVDVSVLFVDIAGYTRLAERLDSSRVNELVELYFGAFLDEILRYGGDVNETAGDGLMVIFRDDDPRRHARAAALTALRILERARQIGRETDHAVGPIALHVGVNSGVAAVGATKIEGKAGTRWTYTASGSVTNVAARLAALGAGGGVLIGPETRARIHGELWEDLPGEQGELPIEDLGERRLRNVAEPVHVYRLATAGC
jgi:class 3 adenylate cyclase